MNAAAGVWAAVGAWAMLGMHASWTDLRRAVISRRACWAAGIAVAALLGASTLALGDPRRYARTLAGAAAVGLLTEIAYRARPEAIGYGDIRLVIVNSLLLSWWGPAWPWWALAAGAAAAWPQALLGALRHGRNAAVRCAPALTLGAGLIVASRLAADGPIP